MTAEVRAVREWGDGLAGFLYRLHFRLALGHTGETIAGVLGLIGLLFVITGTIVWWQTRRTFKLRAWPARMTRPAIIRHHRDLGVVAAPLLLLSMATGSLMIFQPLAKAVLAPWGSLDRAEAAELPPAGAAGPETDWQAIFAAARARFPEAAPRRLQFDPQFIRFGDAVSRAQRKEGHLWCADRAGRT